jgi:signal transduction histidine kinase
MVRERVRQYRWSMTQSVPGPLSVALARVDAPRPVILRSPAIAILLVSTLIAIPLILLATLDTAGLRVLWDNLHWSETAVAAAIAAIVSIRGSVGRVRAIRTAGSIALTFWMIVNLLWAYLNLVGRATVPSIADVFIFAILVPSLVVIRWSIRGRLSWAEQVAVFLDSALIVCLLATILIIGHGSTAMALPSASGIIALAYPTAFIGLGAGGFVALVAVRYPIAPRGAFVLIVGSVAIGLGYLGWVAPTVDGVHAGELPSILFTAGTLLAAYGIATWEDARNDDPRYVAATRFISRVIGPTAAAVIFLALLPEIDPTIEPIVDGAVFLTGILFVIRQALLLRERTTMLDEVTSLKLDNDRLVDELRCELEEHALDQRRMIQASRAAAVGELAAGVAHEVNNPLAAVLGFAELLFDDLDPDDPRRSDVETIRTQALRARSIIRALGDFAQRGAPALAPTDLGGLVRRTVDLVRFQVERRGVTIDEKYDDLPELLIDPQAIQQAVINVLTNATLAVADHGRIEVAVGGTDAVATIVVSDDGVGMSDTTVHRAFEPFFTGRDPDSGDGLATGLGLAVSRGLIEAHSGTITLTSRPGLGTRVELRLPLNQPTAADDGSAPGGQIE